MAQKPKLQPIRIRVDRSRLGEVDSSGSGGGGGGCISKCRSFPRFLHGSDPAGASGASAGHLDVPFKQVASGLSFGGSVSSVGSLGGGAMSSTGSLEVHAPSVHAADSPTASLLWNRRSESCPSLVLLQRQMMSPMDCDGQSRSERTSPVPPPRCQHPQQQQQQQQQQEQQQQQQQEQQQQPQIVCQATSTPAEVTAHSSEAATADDSADGGGLRRFTGGSALNRQTRRSRRKCEEWIVKLDN